MIMRLFILLSLLFTITVFAAKKQRRFPLPEADLKCREYLTKHDSMYLLYLGGATIFTSVFLLSLGVGLLIFTKKQVRVTA